LAGEIEAATGAKPEVFAGRTGSFEITADGELLFSKLQTGRFPELDEILKRLEI